MTTTETCKCLEKISTAIRVYERRIETLAALRRCNLISISYRSEKTFLYQAVIKRLKERHQHHQNNLRREVGDGC